MFKTFDTLLSKTPKWAIFLGAIVIIYIITIENYNTNAELSLVFIFLVFITAWYVVPLSAIIISLVSALSWTFNDSFTGNVFTHYALPPLNTLVRFGIFTVIGLFLIEVKRLWDQKVYFAETDDLTKLANRRSYLYNLDGEILRNVRYKREFTIIYMDLDNFKFINDTYGHEMGDSLLRVVANTLKMHLRRSDIIARMGGDEFAVLLPETNYKGAEKVLREMHTYILDAMTHNKWPVTFSIGAITFIKAIKDSKDMITAVDSLMYSIKQSGKNSIIHEVR